MENYLDRQMKRRFPELVKAERAAWRALMNDPRVLADPRSEHTPELRAAWEAAADAHRVAYLSLEGART